MKGYWTCSATAAAMVRSIIIIYNFVRLINSHKNDTLRTIMIDFGHSLAIDPRDKAFAYIGIAKDDQEIIPDYTASVQKAYADAVKIYCTSTEIRLWISSVHIIGGIMTSN